MSGAAKEPTLKLGNSPYFFNTHFEKQRFSPPFPGALTTVIFDAAPRDTPIAFSTLREGASLSLLPCQATARPSAGIEAGAFPHPSAYILCPLQNNSGEA
jgi:hypothetical protein